MNIYVRYERKTVDRCCFFCRSKESARRVSTPAAVQQALAAEPVVHHLVDVGQTVHVDTRLGLLHCLETKMGFEKKNRVQCKRLESRNKITAEDRAL